MYNLYVGRVPSKEELEQLYLCEGMAISEIGAQYSRSAYYINKWLDEYKIPKRDSGSSKKPPKEELEQLYLAGTMSVSDVGREFGCSEYMVKKWLDEYKIPKRAHLYYRRSESDSDPVARKPSIKDRPAKARRTNTCTILKDYSSDLRDDPERLSTKFLQNLIGVECK